MGKFALPSAPLRSRFRADGVAEFCEQVLVQSAGGHKAESWLSYFSPQMSAEGHQALQAGENLLNFYFEVPSRPGCPGTRDHFAKEKNVLVFNADYGGDGKRLICFENKALTVHSMEGARNTAFGCGRGGRGYLNDSGVRVVGEGVHHTKLIGLTEENLEEKLKNVNR